MFFNLTKRQLICFGSAALIGVPIFFLVKGTGNVSLAALTMMIVMLPLFFLAMYEKDGQPLEVIAGHFIQAKFIRPKVRPYQTNNYGMMIHCGNPISYASIETSYWQSHFYCFGRLS